MQAPFLRRLIDVLQDPRTVPDTPCFHLPRLLLEGLQKPHQAQKTKLWLALSGFAAFRVEGYRVWGWVLPDQQRSKMRLLSLREGHIYIYISISISITTFNITTINLTFTEWGQYPR